MRIITLNANGIRSAGSKGLFGWIAKQEPDVVCVQETKAQEDQLGDALYRPKGYHCYYFDALKKGYSGVAIYAKRKPDNVTIGYGSKEFDGEGRYLEAQFGKLSVVSLYAAVRLVRRGPAAAKFRFLAEFMPHLTALKRKRRDFILCGDWNIAHKEIDLRNWRSNQKNSGFLPQERAWLDQLFGDVGYVDGFREINPKPDQYTWWSNRGQAWAKNVGWRIDYQILSPGLRGSVLRREHLQEATLLRSRAARDGLRLQDAMTANSAPPAAPPSAGAPTFLRACGPTRRPRRSRRSSSAFPRARLTR